MNKQNKIKSFKATENKLMFAREEGVEGIGEKGEKEYSQ